VAQFIVNYDHTAVVLGTEVALKGGQIITDLEFNVPALIEAGFEMVEFSPTVNLALGAMSPPWCPTTSDVSSVTIGTGGCPAWYFGRARRLYSGGELRVAARIVIGPVTTTWAEVFLAKGGLESAGNQTLTVVGVVSVAVEYAAPGLITVEIPMPPGQLIESGSDMWFGFANAALEGPTFRSSSVGDSLDRGFVVDAAGAQPSLIVGVPTLFTVSPALVPQFAVYGG
jgi:hypothetical protein